MEPTHQSQPHNAPPHRRIKHKGLIIAFVIFLALILLIVWFAFSSPGESNKITGFAIGNTEKNPIKLKGELTIPDLKINNKINKIEIITTASANTILYIGDEKFDLSKVADSSIVIFDFNGKISFNSKKILNLDGKATQILINGIPTTPQSGDTIKIGVDENFLYKSLKIKDISLRSLSYITSGTIKINDQKISIDLHDEQIDIRGFQGNLEVEEFIFKINGQADKLEVQGKLDLKVS